jgi:hypothetical protein
MQEFLSVVIGADGSQLTKTLKELENDLKSFQEKLKTTKSVDEIRKLNGAIERTQKQINAIKNINDPFKPLVKGSNQASMSLLNTGRVIQDLPYGVMGVANNINPLLESFQRLQAETGSTSKTLKALGASLIGGGGIGLAVSVVTSLLVVFSDKLFKSGNDAKSQADKIKEAKQALEDYVEGLNDIDKARVKGLQSAQEELVKLRTLYSATQNANIPLNERRKLVDQLQEQYPKYFKNISDEIILAGGAKKAYDDLSTAIIASARARAAQDSLVELQKQLLALEQQKAQAVAETAKAEQKLKTTDGKFLETSNLGFGTSISVSSTNKVVDAEKNLNKAKQKTVDLQKQINELTVRANQLAGEVSKSVERNPAAILNPTGNETKASKSKVEKVNFFDEFLDFDPSKVKDNTEETLKAYTTFLSFALENNKRLIGLDDLLKIESKASAVKAANDWWQEYNKAFIEGRGQEFLKNNNSSIEIKPKIVSTPYLLDSFSKVVK